MQARLTSTNIGAQLLVKNPISSHITSEYLLSLPRDVRWKAVYGRLYKLRHFIDAKGRLSYCQLLRSRTKRGDFELRRKLFLDISSPLSEKELVHRLANTYAFVFNATCNPTDTPPVARFYDEWKQISEPTKETSVLNTILRMHYEMRLNPKLLCDYKWVDDVREFYNQYESLKEQKKAREFSQLHNLKISQFIGFYQYEKTLMSLNESLNLCL